MIERLMPGEISIVGVCSYEPVNVKELCCSEHLITRRLRILNKASSIYRLGPFLDRNGVLQVSVRIKQAEIPEDVKHPILLPRKGHITQLVIRHFHEKVEHQGRNIAIRDTLVRILDNLHSIHGCLLYIQLRQVSKIARHDSRTEDGRSPAQPDGSMPPFTYATVDYFGPWLVKEGRK